MRSPQTKWTSCVWVWLIPLIAALVGCGGSPRKPPASDEALVDLTAGPPDIVVLALDTVRADHFGCYGNGEVQTPHIDRFAAQSVLFEDCGAPATWTLPSFASFYTGRLPIDHGAVGETSLRPRPDLPLLAEVLASRSFLGRAFVGVDFLTDHFTMDRGFEHSVIALDTQVTGRWNRYSSYIFELIRNPPERPLFLFSHWFDAHDPYAPPPPYQRMYFEGDPFAAPADADQSIDVIYSDRNRIDGDPRERYRWLSRVKNLQLPVKEYAAGITYLDSMVGAMLDSLERSDRLRDAIVVLMADHGEHLTEHDTYFTHRWPYAECLQVPLMIRLPEQRLAGTRVSEPVSLIDVLPTLAALIGFPLEQPVEGLDLTPVMRGGELPDRILFAEYGGRSDNWAKAVWDADYRYIEFSSKGRRWAELYDRDRDPREERDLSEQEPEIASRYREHLDARFGPERRLLATEVEASGELDPEVEARLRALGYIN